MAMLAPASSTFALCYGKGSCDVEVRAEPAPRTVLEM